MKSCLSSSTWKHIFALSLAAAFCPVSLIKRSGGAANRGQRNKDGLCEDTYQGAGEMTLLNDRRSWTAGDPFFLLSPAGWNQRRQSLSCQVESTLYLWCCCLYSAAVMHWLTWKWQPAALSGQQATLGFHIPSSAFALNDQMPSGAFYSFLKMNWPGIAQLMSHARQKTLSCFVGLLWV